MKTFRLWKLAFKKAVAAASNSGNDDVYIWIAAVEKATSLEDLADSGAFPELDALLAAEWDKVITGEFKKKVQKLELDLQLVDKMIKGRQITWMVYHHFHLSDIDGAMNSWYDLLNVQLNGDNLQQFINDWDTTCSEIGKLPDDEFLEDLFRKQLDQKQLP